jgi:uncharacterized membrane protein YgaE (UPF0421/DUF939 family)
MNYSAFIPALQLSLRAALSGGLAAALAELMGLPHPLYALIGAIIVTDLSPAETRQLGLRRLAGSVVGAAVGAGMSYFLPPALWAIVISVFVAMFLCYLLKLQGAAKLSGVVCGIVMLGYSDHPWSYGFFRLIETILGIGMAVLVSLVPKLIPVDQSKEQGS